MIVRAFLIYSSDFNVCTDRARICFNNSLSFFWKHISFCRFSLSCSFVIVSELFCGELLEGFAILLAILLPIKSLALALFYFVSLEFCSVNHTSIYENSESKVFKNIKFWVKIFNN